jgi:hypothetical protein
MNKKKEAIGSQIANVKNEKAIELGEMVINSFLKHIIFLEKQSLGK